MLRVDSLKHIQGSISFFCHVDIVKLIQGNIDFCAVETVWNKEHGPNCACRLARVKGDCIYRVDSL